MARNITRSIRFRIGVIFILLSVLVVISALAGFQAIASRNTNDPIFDTAALEAAMTYRLSTLASSLVDVPTETQKKGVADLLRSTIDSYDEAEKELDEGVAVVNNEAVTTAHQRA